MDLSFPNIQRKFFGAWRTSDQTGQQVVRGSFLIFFERFVIKILYFIRTVILARILFPDDFGLFGMAVLARKPDVSFYAGAGCAIFPIYSNIEDVISFMAAKKINYLMVENRYLTKSYPQFEYLMNPVNSPAQLSFVQEFNFADKKALLYELKD